MPAQATLAQAHHVEITGDHGPWLILAHGIGGHPSDWSALVDEFRHTHRVLTFAQAGSLGADPTLLSMTRHASPLGFADDIGLLLAEMGIRGGTFVGHSLSANAGAIAAAGDPGLFAKLVLIGGSPRYVDDPATGYIGGFTADEVDNLLSAMKNDYSAWSAGFGEQMMANANRPEFAREFVTALQRLEPAVAITTLRAALTADFRKIYPRISVPVLVVQSKDDPAVSAYAAQWVARHTPSASLVELDAAGHFPHIVDPDEVIRAITPFVSA